MTITADGVYGHPVGADDVEQLVTRNIFPSTPPSTLWRSNRSFRNTADSAARAFPCA